MPIAITNPFSLGITERIRDEGQFIQLFEPSVLKEISWDAPLNKPLFYWLSSEGAGKSTILTAFTPEILRQVAQLDQNERTAKILREIGAIGEGGPEILGIHTKCTVSYAYIEDLPLEATVRRRMFLALLNSKVALSGLRGLCLLVHRNYPEGLDSLRFEVSDTVLGLPHDFPTHGDGRSIHQWARPTESSCLRAIDAGFGSTKGEGFPGHDAFIAQRLFESINWTFNGKPVARRVIIMLDDAQELTAQQRNWLAECISLDRAGAVVWMAARLHALQDAAQFHGAQEGREFEEQRLESLWSDIRDYRVFLRELGNRRLRSSPIAGLREYSDMLQSRPDSGSSEARDVADRCNLLLDELLEKIKGSAKNLGKYRAWIEWAQSPGTPFEKLVNLREVEILVARDIKSSQKRLLDAPYDLEVLTTRRDSSTRKAAEALLAREYDLPVYYGFDTMAYLSHRNPLQFLRISERLYEDALSRDIRQLPSASIPCVRQDQLVREVAEKTWESIRSRLVQGDDIQRLLKAMVDRCDEEFLYETAPYAPAPVGISVPRDEYSLLQKNDLGVKEFESLRTVLANSLSANLLSVEDRQDKSKPVKVFYINGLVLAHHGLPVDSRQFQPSSLSEFASWLNEGYRPAKQHRKSMAGKTRRKKPPSRQGKIGLDQFFDAKEGDSA